jgi:hypothetical protein
MYSDDEDSVSSNSEEQQPSSSRDADCLPSTDSSNHKITEGELNGLIRDLELPKHKAELASRLRQWNLLRHKGKWSAAMLGYYCWMMKRDASKTKYHRQTKMTRR